jgi:hypothetical protein
VIVLEKVKDFSKTFLFITKPILSFVLHSKGKGRKGQCIDAAAAAADDGDEKPLPL